MHVVPAGILVHCKMAAILARSWSFSCMHRGGITLLLVILLMAATPPVGSLKIAVLYATKGGLGDVGKYAAVHALRRKGVTVVGLSQEAAEGTDLGIEVDVLDKEAKDKFKEDFARAVLRSLKLAYKSIVDVLDKEAKEKFKEDFKGLGLVEKVDIGSEQAQAKLEAAIAGCSAVVACLGNR
ncbi:hypothetical protein T484DRAFT_1827599 [Baffinella frigidus]|nr:hypothetical protein T484DRAFT_1827599 [Cryptophyta sp. CCMP2293]